MGFNSPPHLSTLVQALRGINWFKSDRGLGLFNSDVILIKFARTGALRVTSSENLFEALHSPDMLLLSFR